MALASIFDIAGSAMSAQSTRLNVIASNLSNADSMASSKDAVYHAKLPVFETIMKNTEQGISGGVRIASISESTIPARREFQPGNPLADKEGYVYLPSVNAIEEMANMISASRSYQDNVEMMETAKSMIMRTIHAMDE